MQKLPVCYIKFTISSYSVQPRRVYKIWSLSRLIKFDDDNKKSNFRQSPIIILYLHDNRHRTSIRYNILTFVEYESIKIGNGKVIIIPKIIENLSVG